MVDVQARDPKEKTTPGSGGREVRSARSRAPRGRKNRQQRQRRVCPTVSCVGSRVGQRPSPCLRALPPLGFLRLITDQQPQQSANQKSQPSAKRKAAGCCCTAVAPNTTSRERRRGAPPIRLPNEVGVRGIERGHERVELSLELLGDGEPRGHRSLAAGRCRATSPLRASVALGKKQKHKSRQQEKKANMVVQRNFHFASASRFSVQFTGSEREKKTEEKPETEGYT